MADLKVLQIFVSSPGDVSEERALAERALRRLGEKYRESVRLEIVLWEHEPLFAHAGFQQQIQRPSQCDLVICILWSRLGTRLPAGFRLKLESNAQSGTEFEVHDALEAYRRAGRPNLLIYRKTSAPLINLASTEARERLQQYELLDDFCRRAFYDEQGAVIVAHHSYAESHEFERKLGEHVRKWLERQVGEAAIRARWTSGSPYRGLQAFQAEHREIYFGRSQALSDLIRRLRESETRAASGERVIRFLLLQGMSGVGKSSLVRAGLLPLLEGRALEGIGLWEQAILKPSDRLEHRTETGLVDALAAALAKTIPAVGRSYPDTAQLTERLRNAPGESAARLDGYLAQEAIGVGLRPDQIRLVVFIDQLEELFEPALQPGERAAFIGILHALACEGRVWVVATMRSDFAPRIEEHPELIVLTSEGHLHILGPPQSDELADMIREPALAAGLQWDVREGVSLDQAILREASANPESLPLLEYALDQLYERHDGRRLTYAAYEEIGGLTGSISTTAETVLKAADAESRRAVRRVFRILVGVDEAGRASRRYARMTEIEEDPAQKRLVDRLVEARLCVTDQRDRQPVVAFAHDSLLRTLPALIAWLKEEAGLLQTRELAQRDAALWQQHGESDAWLAASDKLVTFKALERADMVLPKGIRDFLDRSERQVRRVARLKQGAVGLIAMLAVLATIAAWVASNRRREAEYQTAQALSAQMGLLTEAAAQRLKDGDLAYARGIVLEVLRHASPSGKPNPAIVDVFQEIRAADPAQGILAGHDGPVRRATYSPDGSRILTASLDDTARVWDARTGIQLMVLSGHTRAVLSAAYSPDGARIATASRDDTARVWDAHTGHQLFVIKESEGLASVVYSPDGSQIATVSSKRLRIWNAFTGDPIAAFSVPGISFGTPEGDSGNAATAAYSPDGSRIVTIMQDKTARVWDARTGRVLLVLSGHTRALASAVYSPDGRRILTSGDYTARVFDAVTGHALLVLSGHEGYVWSAEYSPDGTLIATASVDKTARVWDAATGKQLRVLSGHTNILGYASFSPDGSHLVTAGWDGTARTWYLRNGPQAVILSGHSDAVTDVQYSPDGAYLATASDDKTARIWDTRTGRPVMTLRSPSGGFLSVAYSPNGTRILTASDDKTARVWDARTGASLRVLKAPDRVVSAAYSPDGKRVVCIFGRLTFGVWDLRTGALTVRSGHRDSMTSAMFSPDGSKILTASVDKTARLWDSTTLAPLTVLRHGDFLNVAVFSNDGKRIVTAVDDSTARIWDAHSGEQMAVLSGHRSFVYAVAFSPDGTRVVTGSKDGTLRIWDTNSATQLAALTGHDSDVTSVAYSPDGTHIATASADGTARIWDAAIPAELTAQVLWEDATEADPLSEVQKTQLGLAPTTALLADATIASYAPAAGRAAISRADTSPCDRQAAAFYDPERHAQGMYLESVEPEIAVPTCMQLAAARRPQVRALYQLGRALYAKHDFVRARRELERALAQGYNAAAIDLALLITDSRARMLDPARALSLYQQAWTRGIRSAGDLLGQLYEHGVSSESGAAVLPKDSTQAWIWYQKAAKAGDPHALARFAERGENASLKVRSGLEMDERLLSAFELYAQAAQRAAVENWPDSVSRIWRYRRASLARVLAADGMMKQVAGAYALALSGGPIRLDLVSFPTSSVPAVSRLSGK